MHPVQSPTANLLLAGMRKEDYGSVAADLELVELPAGEVLYHPFGEIGYFWFITEGFVSLLQTTEDGHTAEISLVGNEGGFGLTLVLGGSPPPIEAVVQMPARAWRLPVDRLRAEFARGGDLQWNLLRFARALMVQMAQTVVCNRHHSVALQFCRWILLSLDRVPGSDLDMTHETIARMLGVRRAGVTEAAARLQREGLIEYRRGHIHVPDRAALEARACECYHLIRKEYEFLRQEVIGRVSAA